jgi:cardiolipin synthase
VYYAISQENVMKEINRKKRLRVSIALAGIWLFCIAIYLLFTRFVHVLPLHSAVIVISETLLCLLIWIFFMVKINWLRDLDSGRHIMYLNISNVLTSLRLCLLPLLITMFGLVSNREHPLYMRLAILLLALLLGLTDFFDGMLARVRHEVTMLGRILDPIGDFTLIFSISILIFSQGVIQWWYFTLIQIRFTVMSLFLVYMVLSKISFKVKTTPLGKTTVFYTMCLLGLCMIHLLLQVDISGFYTIIYLLQFIGGVIIIASSIEKGFYLKTIINTQQSTRRTLQ